MRKYQWIVIFMFLLITPSFAEDTLVTKNGHSMPFEVAPGVYRTVENGQAPYLPRCLGTEDKLSDKQPSAEMLTFPQYMQDQLDRSSSRIDAVEKSQNKLEKQNKLTQDDITQIRQRVSETEIITNKLERRFNKLRDQFLPDGRIGKLEKQSMSITNLENTQKGIEKKIDKIERINNLGYFFTIVAIIVLFLIIIFTRKKK